MIAQTNSTTQSYPTSERARIDIEALVKIKLPPMKGTAMRILELLRDEDASTQSLAAAVGCDPILTARVLRLANSVFYSPRRAVTTIEKALESIGTKSLYDIVILDAMAAGFTNDIRNSVLVRNIWAHSVAVGLLSRELVKILALRGGEEAFVCGLLHDIGRILLLRADFERFATLLDQKTDREMIEWEEENFGFNHMEVGAYVADQWRLPETICSVILYHHEPSEANISLVMANIVNAADMVANAYGYGLRLEEDEALMQSESVALLNLSRSQMLNAWDNVQDAIEEVISMFK